MSDALTIMRMFLAALCIIAFPTAFGALLDIRSSLSVMEIRSQNWKCQP